MCPTVIGKCILRSRTYATSILDQGSPSVMRCKIPHNSETDRGTHAVLQSIVAHPELEASGSRLSDCCLLRNSERKIAPNMPSLHLLVALYVQVHHVS